MKKSKEELRKDLKELRKEEQLQGEIASNYSLVLKLMRKIRTREFTRVEELDYLTDELERAEDYFITLSHKESEKWEKLNDKVYNLLDEIREL